MPLPLLILELLVFLGECSLLLQCFLWVWQGQMFLAIEWVSLGYVKICKSRSIRVLLLAQCCPGGGAQMCLSIQHDLSEAAHHGAAFRGDLDGVASLKVC